ncbi:hypothetical protein HDU99_001142, partial [Rhizoclosmatium hyalinum]
KTLFVASYLASIVSAFATTDCVTQNTVFCSQQCGNSLIICLGTGIGATIAVSAGTVCNNGKLDWPSNCVPNPSASGSSTSVASVPVTSTSGASLAVTTMPPYWPSSVAYSACQAANQFLCNQQCGSTIYQCLAPGQAYVLPALSAGTVCNNGFIDWASNCKLSTTATSSTIVNTVSSATLTTVTSSATSLSSSSSSSVTSQITTGSSIPGQPAGAFLYAPCQTVNQFICPVQCGTSIYQCTGSGYAVSFTTASGTVCNNGKLDWPSSCSASGTVASTASVSYIPGQPAGAFVYAACQAVNQFLCPVSCGNTIYQCTGAGYAVSLITAPGTVCNNGKLDWPYNCLATGTSASPVPVVTTPSAFKTPIYTPTAVVTPVTPVTPLYTPTVVATPAGPITPVFTPTAVATPTAPVTPIFTPSAVTPTFSVSTAATFAPVLQPAGAFPFSACQKAGPFLCPVQCGTQIYQCTGAGYAVASTTAAGTVCNNGMADFAYNCVAGPGGVAVGGQPAGAFVYAGCKAANVFLCPVQCGGLIYQCTGVGYAVSMSVSAGTVCNNGVLDWAANCSGGSGSVVAPSLTASVPSVATTIGLGGQPAGSFGYAACTGANQFLCPVQCGGLIYMCTGAGYAVALATAQGTVCNKGVLDWPASCLGSSSTLPSVPSSSGVVGPTSGIAAVNTTCASFGLFSCGVRDNNNGWDTLVACDTSLKWAYLDKCGSGSKTCQWIGGNPYCV